MDADATFAAYYAKCARAAALKAEILPRNKAVLFAALQAAGAMTVTIEFDGYGDSGQLEAAVAYDAAAEPLALPNTAITVEDVDFESGTILNAETNVASFIETLAYDLLEGQHDGWENDDGAYGQFRFDAAEQTIRLEYWERYTETNYHEHEL